MFSFWKRKIDPAVRPLRSEQAGQCARIHAESFAHPWNQIELEAMLTSQGHVCDGVFDGGKEKLLSFSIWRLAADEAELLTIATHSDFRGNGLAGTLLRWQIGELPRHGACRLFLEVEENNHAALALYARLGFVKAGERPGYYRQGLEQPRNALILSRTV